MRPPTILVVEDDPSTRKLFRLTLEGAGYAVLEAPDGATALELARSQAPNLVLVDLWLPDMSGIEVLQQLRALPTTEQAPVIAVSGLLSQQEDVRVAGAGFTDVLLKPVEPSRLLRTVQVFERQAAINQGLVRRSALQAAELAVLSAISEALGQAVSGELPLEETPDSALSRQDSDESAGAEATGVGHGTDGARAWPASRSKTLAAGLEETLARCLDAGGIPQGALYLVDEEGSLRLAAARGYRNDLLPGVASCFGHADLLQQVVLSGSMVALPSAAVPESPTRDYLTRAGVDQALIAPVLGEGKILGALVMGSRTRTASEDDWRIFVTTVAARLGQALALTRAIAKLRASEERYRRLLHENEMILDSAGEGICRLDGSGRVTFVNAAAVKMLGYFPHEMVGELMHALSHQRRPDGSPYPADECPILDTLESGMTHLMVEDLLRRKDGSFLDVEFTSAPIHESGRLAGAVVIIKDITERKRQQEDMAKQREALHQSEKLAAMASLVAGVAHELNNPLSVVMGQANLLQRAAKDTAMAPRAEKIVQAAERCARIVRNFLALARQQPPERQRVHLNQVVQDVVELLGYQLRLDSVEVVLALTPELPWLWADPYHLQQVMVNLVTNAQHAMRKTDRPPRLTLTTSLGPERSRVVISVADNGPGIPLDLQSRIFEPFFTTKPVGEGTGLGLSLCRGIVADHGGEIRMITEEQVGTCFVVELPAEGARPHPAPAAAVEAEAPAGPVPKGKRVLVVDDEETVRELLAEMLRGDDHVVETAVNGAEALEKSRADRYDLVVCDVKMPVMDGPAFFREVERTIPALAERFVFITGDVLSPGSREFLEQAGRPTLPKPFDMNEVRGVVRGVLRNG